MKKKVKKKLNVKGLLVIILTLYLCIMIFFYVFTLPIKTIVVTGNDHISDNEIINVAGISDYPILFKTNTNKIKKNIMKLDYISDVDIKKSILGKITINVKEEKVLFYNTLNSTYVLSNQEETTSDDQLLGVPILINYTPDDIYKELVEGLNKIDKSILSMISEIEYDPNISNDLVIDETRFLLKMNDGNYVYLNTVNIEKLNKYIKAIASLDEGEKGILYLDSNSNNNVFKTFTSIEEAKAQEQEVLEDELSEGT